MRYLWSELALGASLAAFLDNFDAAFMLACRSWASGPTAPEICALLIWTKGIEHIIVSTYPGGEVAVHAGSSRTCSTART